MLVDEGLHVSVSLGHFRQFACLLILLFATSELSEVEVEKLLRDDGFSLRDFDVILVQVAFLSWLLLLIGEISLSVLILEKIVITARSLVFLWIYEIPSQTKDLH